MSNNGGERFILTTKLYKSTNNAALFVSVKWKLEGKANVQQEGTAVENKKQTTTKQLVTRKIHAN